MKRVLLIFALFGAFALAANAQQKACCAGKKAAAKTETCSKADQAAMDEAASADASIVKQVSNTGEVTYVRKEVDEKSGKVSYTDVEFCTKSKKFINVSPSEGEATTCTKGKATKVASKDGAKSCCSGAEKKACCAGGKKAKVSKASSAAKAKLTGQEEGTN